MTMDPHSGLQLQGKRIVLEGLGLHRILAESVQGGVSRDLLGSGIIKLWKGESTDTREIGVEFLLHFWTGRRGSQDKGRRA